MANDENKISVKQFLLMFILLFCAPAIRYVPLYSSQMAKQAAWLSPVVAFIPLFIYVLIWNKFIEKYGNKSFSHIIKDILGKVLGTVVSTIYFIWITFFLSYNVRMYAERILGSAMPGVSIFILVGSMLLIVWHVVKDGINPLAKMSELFFYSLGLIFIIYNILVVTEVDFTNMYPITLNDVVPVLKGSAPVISIFRI